MEWIDYKISSLLHLDAQMKTLNYLIRRHNNGINYEYEIKSLIRQVKGI